MREVQELFKMVSVCKQSVLTSLCLNMGRVACLLAFCTQAYICSAMRCHTGCVFIKCMKVSLRMLDYRRPTG